jgi:DNA polymerase-3 subunit epsilon
VAKATNLGHLTPYGTQWGGAAPHDLGPSENAMLRNLTLARPLAVIDLETTGTDPKQDRIVEISVLKILPDGQQVHRTRRLNPGVPIPAAATAVHGISDADVAGEPRFAQVAGGLLAFLDGCDPCGYNLKRFDLRVLCGEFARAGRQFVLEGRAVLDPMEIFHRCQPRDLAAAVRTYLGREHDGGHSAAADVVATAEVLDAMLARHADLPRDVAGLHQHFTDPDRVDSDGFFRWVEGTVRVMRGIHRGAPLDALAAASPGYLGWMLTRPFFEDTKQVVRQALARAGGTARTILGATSGRET